QAAFPSERPATKMPGAAAGPGFRARYVKARRALPRHGSCLATPHDCRSAGGRTVKRLGAATGLLLSLTLMTRVAEGDSWQALAGPSERSSTGTLSGQSGVVSRICNGIPTTAHPAGVGLAMLNSDATISAVFNIARTNRLSNVLQSPVDPEVQDMLSRIDAPR